MFDHDRMLARLAELDREIEENREREMAAFAALRDDLRAARLHCEKYIHRDPNADSGRNCDGDCDGGSEGLPAAPAG